MVDDTVRTVCLTLLRRRMVPSAELKILTRTLGLEDEVRARLADVGFILVTQPRVPFYAVLPDPNRVTADDRPDAVLTLLQRGVLTYLWSRLIGPHVWGEVQVPDPWDSDRITLTSIERDLVPAKIKRKQDLKRVLTRLVNLDYIRSPRGAANTYVAGPGLWLGVQHSRLAQYLRDEKAWQVAATRQGLDLPEAPEADPAETEDDDAGL